MEKIGNRKILNDFERLYFENYSKLCQSIYRFVSDEEITKDIVQEVFLKYWQKIPASPPVRRGGAGRHELRINESPKAYLKRACINQALN